MSKTNRVSKSEEDFLKEFEAELAGEEPDGFWNDFEDSMAEKEKRAAFDEEPVSLASGSSPFDELTATPTGGSSPFDELTATPTGGSSPFDELAATSTGGNSPFDELTSTSTGGNSPFDELAATSTGGNSPFDELTSTSTGGSSPFNALDSSSASGVSPFDALAMNDENTSGDDMGDVFATLFGDSDMSGDYSAFDEESALSEGMDLSNMEGADLMSILSEEEGLSDIGNMLSSDAEGGTEFGDADAFAAFAAGEMEAQEAEEEPEEEEGSKKKKKKKAKKKKEKKQKPEKKKERPSGFMGKLYDFFEFLMKEDDGREEIDLDEFNAITPDMLAGENAEILAEFANLEDKSAKPDKKKKDKKKKEKKEKPKKEKKPRKEKKPKEPKPKKEKKEKKPKPVDNTPPLPKGPVLVIWIMVISMFALVMLCVNLFSYSSAVSEAKKYMDEGEYVAAYSELAGITMKEKDLMLYNQAATLAAVESELNAFDAFHYGEKHQEALDSLVCAAGRCEVNADNAEVYECNGQMQILQAEITNKLYECYGMTYEEAIEIYQSRSRDTYSVLIVEKLRSLGLVE